MKAWGISGVLLTFPTDVGPVPFNRDKLGFRIDVDSCAHVRSRPAWLFPQWCVPATAKQRWPADLIEKTSSEQRTQPGLEPLLSEVNLAPT